MDEFQSSFLHYVILNQEEVGNKYIKQDTELKNALFSISMFSICSRKGTSSTTYFISLLESIQNLKRKYGPMLT